MPKKQRESLDLTDKVAQAYIECKQIEIKVLIANGGVTILGRVIPTPPGKGFKATILLDMARI